MSIEIAELPGTRRRGAEADQVLSTTELGREVNVGGSAGLRLHKLFLRPGIQAPGESLVTITAQNAKGGVNTVQKKIVIQ